MKKMICLLLAVCMLLSLAACGAPAPKQETTASPPEQAAAEWTRQGYYFDELGNMLSVTRMDDVDDPGWYVGFMNGEDFIEDAYGGMLPQEGNTLHGALPSSGSKPDITVTVSEEGENGLLLVIEGGESYHFTVMEMEAPLATLWVNTEGYGSFSCVEEGDDSEVDTNTTSLQYGLAEPTSYLLTAYPGEDWYFVKWTLNGEDYSTQEQITIEVGEDTDIVAVFDFAGSDGQNPVMNFIGSYQCDRANALVECIGDDGAQITIKWGGSAWELAQWDIVGRLDLDTLTVDYTGCTKSILVYDDSGELKSREVEYEDGTGSIVFHDDGSFTWHEDQADREDMLFEWLPVAEERCGFEGMWAEEIAGRCQILFSYRGEGSQNVEITWSGSAFERRCWEMTADVYKNDIMIYENAHSWVETYTDEENYTVSDESFDGTGSFYLEDGKLHWINDQTGEDTVFIPA
ncbi:MAG: hypothetical protein IJH48_07925 [Oscillospiraceae bacterium]|nr:hypothetical protein [Oscillospiraceae bacterium]